MGREWCCRVGWLPRLVQAMQIDAVRRAQRSLPLLLRPLLKTSGGGIRKRQTNQPAQEGCRNLTTNESQTQLTTNQIERVCRVFLSHGWHGAGAQKWSALTVPALPNNEFHFFVQDVDDFSGETSNLKTTTFGRLQNTAFCQNVVAMGTAC